MIYSNGLEVQLYRILIEVFIQVKLEDKLWGFEEVSDYIVFMLKYLP